MGSRLRASPKTIFEVFLEVARPADSVEQPFVLQKYPEDFNDNETLQTVPKFVFPCQADTASAVDQFTFTLTDIEGKFKYGFCRQAAGAQTSFCIISFLPWFEIFYKLLHQLAEIVNRGSNDLVPLLAALYSKPVPKPDDLVQVFVPTTNDAFSFKSPSPRLPSIPESRNLTEYFNALDTTNMVTVFASMLFERRVLFVSRKLSRLTSCVHASASLLFPMYWQHLYIPVLPLHLLDYCTAPMPFVIGIHSTFLQKLRRSDLGDVVIVDADKNTVESEHDDEHTLPYEVMSLLRKRLRHHLTRNSGPMTGDWLARCFLRTLVALIGGYRESLRPGPGPNQKIVFDQAAFIQSRGSAALPLLESLLQLQIFDQFISDRLELINSGQGFTDEFELEITRMREKLGGQSYVINMKKLGKGGKEKISELAGRFFGKYRDDKISPDKEVRRQGKKAVKGLQAKLDDLKEQQFGHVDQPGFKPTRPPPPVMRRPALSPPRPVRPAAQSRHYEILDLGSVAPIDVTARSSKRRSSADDLDLDLQRISLDLMTDPDVQAVMKKSYSTEDINRSDSDELYSDSSFDDSESPNYGTLEEEETSSSLTSPQLDSVIFKVESEPNIGISHPHLVVKLPDQADSKKLALSHSSNNLLSATSHTNPQPSKSAEHLNYSSQATTSAFSLAKANLTSVLQKTMNQAQTLPKNLPSTNTVRLRNQPSPGGNQPTICGDENHPVMRRQASVQRHAAFKRPPSTVSNVTDGTRIQSIKDAREAFICAEVMSKPTLPTAQSSQSLGGGLDLFDPLTSAQVSVDHTEPAPKGEDDLLRDWSLDFKQKINKYNQPESYATVRTGFNSYTAFPPPVARAFSPSPAAPTSTNTPIQPSYWVSAHPASHSTALPYRPSAPSTIYTSTVSYLPIAPPTIIRSPLNNFAPRPYRAGAPPNIHHVSPSPSKKNPFTVDPSGHAGRQTVNTDMAHQDPFTWLGDLASTSNGATNNTPSNTVQSSQPNSNWETFN